MDVRSRRFRRADESLMQRHVAACQYGLLGIAGHTNAADGMLDPQRPVCGSTPMAYIAVV